MFPFLPLVAEAAGILPSASRAAPPPTLIASLWLTIPPGSALNPLSSSGSVRADDQLGRQGEIIVLVIRAAHVPTPCQRAI